MLFARNLKLSFGNRNILDDVSLSILANERIALVGKNGAGKSSLLNILVGDDPDAGLVEMNKALRIGVLRQNPSLDKSWTVLQAVRSGLDKHLEDIKQHQDLCQILSTIKDQAEQNKIHKRIEILTHTIEQQGGFDVDFWIERVLSRLGVVARTQAIGTLSGGECRRVDLARVLITSPDVYLLDEPTNHLDVGAIEFLVDTFKSFTGALLFISHDRAFVDEIATKILELDKGKLYSHEPPFSNYIENRLIRELIDQRTLHRNQRLMAEELVWLRAGTPARTTKQNARIDRAYELIDQVEKGIAESRPAIIKADVAKTRRLGATILELDNVGAAYGERILFKGFSLKVVAGQRYGIIGKNGSGKTTLLSIIANKIQPTEGRVILGKNTEIVQFDQQREQLDPNATLKETLADYGDYVFIDEQKIHIASYLERYLFDGSDANRRVSTLSGGEQNRILLAKLFKHAGNCLMLDEPTNDLDMESLAVLEDVLINYEGVCFIISHDRKFLDRVCNNIITFEETESQDRCNLTLYPGNYTDYTHLKKIAEKRVPKTDPEINSKAHVEKTRIKKRRSFKEEQEFQTIEGRIENLEHEKSLLQAELSDVDSFKKDHAVIKQKTERLNELDSEIEALFARWQELCDIGG